MTDVIYGIIVAGFAAFFLIIIIISKISSDNAAYEEYRNKQKKDKEEKERKRILEEKMQSILMAAEKNNIFLKSKYDKLDRAIHDASMAGLTALMTKPNTPTYSRGIYAGSIGDNIATIGNAQKKSDYEKAMKENLTLHKQANKSLYEALRINDDILEQLQKLPECDIYIKMHDEIYEPKLRVLRNEL